MESTCEQRKNRFLKAELVVLVCLLCFWTIKSETVDIRSVIQRFYGPGEIQAIAISNNTESSVMIGGKIACEGDLANGYKIQEIRSDCVMFERNGKVCVKTIPKKESSVKPRSHDLTQQLPSSKKDYQGSLKSYQDLFRQHYILIPAVVYLIVCVFCIVLISRYR